MPVRQPRLLLLVAVAIVFAPAAAAAAGEGDAGPARPVVLLDLVLEAAARNPDIRLAEQDVLEGIGRLREARAAFDTSVQATLGQDVSGTPTTAAVEADTGDALDREARSFYSIGVTKLLPSGMRVMPGVTFERSDGLTGDEPSSNMTSITLSVLVPLMQGKGEAVTGLAGREAEVDLESRRLTLVQKAATSVSSVVSAYWGYLAAVRIEEIVARSEESAGELLETIRRLVDADERPLIDLVPLRASQASKVVARWSAQREVVRARNALALAVGLAPEEIGRLGDPATDFPALEVDEIPRSGAESALMAGIETRRGDLKAAERDAERIKVGLAAVRDQARPKLDLTVGAGLDGLNEGGPVKAFLVPAGVDGVGPRLSVALSYSWPIGGNAQKAVLLQRQAQYEKAVLAREERIRQARIAVQAAMDDLRAAARILSTAQVAVNYHEEAVRAEQKKLTMGLTTVMDLISVEDEYFASLQEQVSARAAFAESIIALRQASGLVLSPAEGMQTLVLENLNGIP